jgi:hypothetical protein
MNPIFNTLDVYHPRLQGLPNEGPPVDDAFVVDNRAVLVGMCESAQVLLAPEQGRATAQTAVSLIDAGLRPDVVAIARRRSDGAAWLTKRIQQAADRLNPGEAGVAPQIAPLEVSPPTAADNRRLSELHTAYEKLHGAAPQVVDQAAVWKLCGAERVASAFIAERFQASATLAALRSVKVAIRRATHADLQPESNLLHRIAAAIGWRAHADPHSGCDFAHRIVFHGDARWRLELTASSFPESPEARQEMLQACSTLLPAILAYVTSQLGELPPVHEFDGWAVAQGPARALETILSDWETIRGNAAYEMTAKNYFDAHLGAGVLAKDPDLAHTFLRIDALPGRPHGWNALITGAVAGGFDKVLDDAAAENHPDKLANWLGWYRPNPAACDRILQGMIASTTPEAWLPAVERITAYGHVVPPATAHKALVALYESPRGDVSRRLAWFRLLMPKAALQIDQLLAHVRKGLAEELLPECLVAALGGDFAPLEQLLIRQATNIRPGEPAPLSPRQVMIWKNLLGAF